MRFVGIAIVLAVGWVGDGHAGGGVIGRGGLGSIVIVWLLCTVLYCTVGLGFWVLMVAAGVLDTPFYQGYVVVVRLCVLSNFLTAVWESFA